MTRFLIAACLAVPLAHAGEFAHYHYLQVPAKDTDAVRSMLASDQMPHTPDAIQRFAKTATRIHTFDEVPCDPETALDGIDPNGEVGIDTQTRNLEVKLRVANGKAANKGLVSVNAYAEEPLGKKNYQGHATDIPPVRMPQGKWSEIATWGRGDGTLMLWAFTPAADPAPDASPTLRIEARFCLATAADIEQLGKSTAETRDKAVKWILGRAKLHRESATLAAPGQRTRWEISDTRLEEKDGSPLAEQTSLHWECKPVTKETGIESTWKITLSGGGSGEETTRALTLHGTPQTWDYAPVDGGKDFNLMLYRISNL